MDNDTYDDRNYVQQKFNKNIVKRIQELEDKKQIKLDDQLDIQLMKQKEFNANVVKRLEELEDFKSQVLVRLDQGIENRTKAFELIEDLQDNIRMIKEYSIDDLKESLRELEYNTDIKLERIDDILVVHRNQTDNQRKNFCALRRVLDDKVMDLLEKGEHGKQE